MKKYLFNPVFLILFCNSNGQAQIKPLKDTLTGSGEEIVVTANRSERKLSNVAVPTTLISKKTIQRTGSLRLQDILQEQTGLVMVNSTLGTSLNGYPNPFGQGIQMLGLDPAYTAILLDGEPLVGRNAGILKLGRIATGNIRQIEIVKGPSSSLYGSEAMAGVINILTETPQNTSVDLQLHRASNDTWGGTISYADKFDKTGVQFFLNRYSSAGYDLDPNLYGKTVDPFREWTGQLKITQEFSKKMQLLVSLRNYDSKQDNNYQIYQQGVPVIASGATSEQDRSAFMQLRWKLNAESRIYFRSFYEQYQNHSFVNLDKTATLFDETKFDQTVLKPEIQFEKTHPGKDQYVAGLGTSFESVDASRYTGLQKLTNMYVFTQKEWYLLQQKLTIVAGARLDKRTDFAVHLSPRLAFAYQSNPHWKFTASVGFGFKAPDFRHMYLNFYNSQIGYSLLGKNSLSTALQKLQQQGLLQAGADINPYLNTNELKPETSFGIHLGAKYTNGPFGAEFGLFRNDIDNLIDVYALPFTRSNGLPIYSYQNTGSVFTEGFETDIRYQISSKWSLAGGYQFLLAKDKQVLAKIDNGQMYKRDPVSFQTTLVTRQDYYGLPNRSRHAVNAKILYDDIAEGLDAYIRVIYRGQFGFMDVNGNNIIDDSREMVAGFPIVNMATSKTIGKHFRVQGGIENVFNYTNPTQMSNIAGRLFFININYSIHQLPNKIKTNRP
jgi:outer membrane receptor for ferrienterochelin and colicins